MDRVEILIPLAPPRPGTSPQTFSPHSAPITWATNTALAPREAEEYYRVSRHLLSSVIPLHSPYRCYSPARMVEAADRQLCSQRLWQGWCGNMLKLSDFRHQSHTAAHVAQLQRAGVRVMLDALFHAGALSPARDCTSMRKLDEHVNDAQLVQGACANSLA